MNLDIIVTHYKEPWEVGQKLFASIALQECVGFEDVRIIVVNDGMEYSLGMPSAGWRPVSGTSPPPLGCTGPAAPTDTPPAESASW